MLGLPCLPRCAPLKPQHARWGCAPPQGPALHCSESQRCSGLVVSATAFHSQMRLSQATPKRYSVVGEITLPFQGSQLLGVTTALWEERGGALWGQCFPQEATLFTEFKSVLGPQTCRGSRPERQCTRAVGDTGRRTAGDTRACSHLWS